ncbi:aspartic peptidase A1 [Mycena albidolilacea]|uniref:Aspartic peptidase A1 n=1 Tax=Mycena albidolilacea TaxID=1033008 RepID=A0AAD6ZFU9_9AGAR|nr:aspartic peptidase A1 [Mycena albidolilacea]
MITRAFTATLILLFAALVSDVQTRFISSSPYPARSSEKNRRASSDDLELSTSDGWYYTDVGIGSLAQTLKMVLDTGSGDIWVGGVPCSDPCPSSLYNPSASSTAVNISTTLVKIAENGESVSGYRSSERMHLGQYFISNSKFLLSETIDPALVPTACSGSLGIAFVVMLGGRGGEIAAPEFGLWLTRAPAAQHTTESPGGTLTIGGTNSLLYSGQIEFLDLTGAASTYWMLSISGITVQGKAINIVQNTTLAAFDTSFRFISGPADVMQAIWATVPACTTDVNVTVSFGGRSWPISAADINLGPANNSNKACIGAIRPYVDADRPSSDWVFGTPFLRNMYSVFRSNSPASIGFAELSSIAGGSVHMIYQKTLIRDVW